VNIQFISTLHDVLVFFVLFNANLTFSRESHYSCTIQTGGLRENLVEIVLENIVRVFLTLLTMQFLIT